MGTPIRIPVGTWAKDMLGEIFPGLTPEQISAIRDGKPVPPSPTWQPEQAQVQMVPKKAEFLKIVQSLVDEARPKGLVSPAAAKLRQPDGDLPIVSCILVFGEESRLKFAKRAVKDFLGQVYPRKELVIVNATELEVDGSQDPRVREVRVQPGVRTVAELRNVGMAHSKGTWIKPCWDDDDIYHPMLLVYQMLHRKDGHALVLSKQLRVDVINSTTYLCAQPHGVANTMIVPADAAKSFNETLTSKEDIRYWADHYGVNTVVADNSQFPATCLSLAVYHGYNVLDVETFMEGRVGPNHAGQFFCSPEEWNYVQQALAKVGYETHVREPAQ